jgi:TolA-binding protein
MNLWKKSLAAAGLCFVFAGVRSSGAEEKEPVQTTAQYLEQLRTKLDHTARRANQPGSEGSSVVGLRGAKQESASKQLYWKGQRGKGTVTTSEVKEYRDAVEQARGGKNDDAIAALKSFQTKYPKSALGPDVQETLNRLSAAPTP